MSNSGGYGNLHLPRGIVFLVAVEVCMAAAAPVSDAGRETLDLGLDLGHLSSSDEIIRMAGYGEEKLSTVLVTGTLLCTSCSSRLLLTSPISGAMVAATCSSKVHYTTGTKKPVWEKGITDENGEFIIDLPSELHAIPDIHKACSVKVLLLPNDSPCKSAMSVARDSVNKIALSSVGNGIRTYTAGTIQFLHKDFKHSRACKKMAMEVKQDMSW